MAYWEGRRSEREVLTMREILFRGKRIDNGEWAVGYLGVFKDRTQIYVPFTEEEERKYRGHIFSSIGGSWYTVDPSTVGQYTGRTDKNGKRVFEGDIIRLYNGAVGVVLWSDNDQAYLIFQDPVKMVILDDFGNYGRPEYYEVIGNIYDNPELLEGGKDNA